MSSSPARRPQFAPCRMRRPPFRSSWPIRRIRLGTDMSPASLVRAEHRASGASDDTSPKQLELVTAVVPQCVSHWPARESKQYNLCRSPLTSLCLRRRRVDDVGFNCFRSAFPERRQVCRSNTIGGFAIHLFECPAITRSAHDGPPIIRGVKRLLSALRNDVGRFDSALRQKLTNGGYRND